MLCSDRVHVEWDYSDCQSTTCTSETIKLLHNAPDALSCLQAHAALTVGQLENLYRLRGYPHAVQLRCGGKKIKRMKLEKYAEGIKSRRKLIKALKGTNRSIIIGRLLELTD